MTAIEPIVEQPPRSPSTRHGQSSLALQRPDVRPQKKRPKLLVTKSPQKRSGPQHHQSELPSYSLPSWNRCQPAKPADNVIIGPSECRDQHQRRAAYLKNSLDNQYLEAFTNDNNNRAFNMTSHRYHKSPTSLAGSSKTQGIANSVKVAYGPSPSIVFLIFSKRRSRASHLFTGRRNIPNSRSKRK